MSPTSRIVIQTFWEYVAFLVNSLIFLLIGLEVNVPALLATSQAVLWAIAAVWAARVIVVYGLNGLINPFLDRIPRSWFHVLHWSGLRGAIALAMVLSLPAAFDDQRELMKLMAFGVVLFTLLVQSTTMRFLLHRLDLVLRLPEDVEFEKRHARLTAARASMKHMERRHAEGLISSHIWEIIKSHLGSQIDIYAAQVRDTLKSAPRIGTEEYDTALREYLRAQRSALFGLQYDGTISEEIFNELSAEIDAMLDADASDLSRLLFGNSSSPEIK
jgi:CPA1 family monovalent cation:H+ antiporter